MSLSTRAMTITGVCIAVAIGGWASGMSTLAKRRPLEQDIELSERAARITNLVLQVRRLEEDSLLSVLEGDHSALSAKKWDDSRALLSDAIARTDDLNLSEQDRHALRQIATDYRVYVDGYERVLSMIRSGRIRTAEQAIERISIYEDSAHRMQANSAAIGARALQRINKTT
jgi:hypothetical protein